MPLLVFFTEISQWFLWKIGKRIRIVFIAKCLYKVIVVFGVVKHSSLYHADKTIASGTSRSESPSDWITDTHCEVNREESWSGTKFLSRNFCLLCQEIHSCVKGCCRVHGGTEYPVEPNPCGLSLCLPYELDKLVSGFRPGCRRAQQKKKKHPASIHCISIV